MDKLIRKRAMAMTISMAMIMVAFTGLMVQADVEPVPDTLDVTVTDTFEPANDGNAYTILDTFEWFIPGTGMNLSNEFTVNLTVGPLGPFDLRENSDELWNDTREGWVFTFAPDSPAYVGDHDWKVVIANETESIEDTGMITIWHPVLLNPGFELPMFYEDTTTAWNITDTWLPMMDEADAYLTFGFGTDYPVPEGWTFTPVMDGMYTHWNVTPPMDFNGWEWVNVTAEDTNGNSAYNVFNLTVMAVNDAPVINGVIFDEMQYEPEWIDVMDMLNVTGVEGNYSWVVELMLEEDQMDVNFTVNATDIETDHANLTYAFDDTISEGIDVEFDAVWHQNNVTIDENLNGYFLVNFTVADAEIVSYVWILFNVTPVNDAPTIMFDDIAMGEEMDKLTGEEINISVSYEDIDNEMEDLTVIWYIDGVEVPEWDMGYFLYTFDTPGMKNVSVWVTDGDDPSEKIYFHVNVTMANTAPAISGIEVDNTTILTTDDLTLMLNYTDAEDNVAEILWTLADSDWNVTGEEVTVTAGTLVAGVYTFTVLITDDMGLTATDTVTITINEPAEVADDDDDDDEGFPIWIIIVIVIILIIIIVIIIIVMKKGKKEEEEVPEEQPMMEGQEEIPAEGGEMPMEGMEQPMEQTYEEAPMEQPMEEPVPEVPVEEPVAEEPVPEEQPVAPPEPEVPAPEPPVAPPEPAPPMPPQ